MNCESKRFLALEGATNFRDVGGYRAFGGKTVKWGVLYRGGDMDALTDGDLKLLADLKLKAIVDFRSEDEIKAAPDRLPQSVERVYNLAIDSGSIFALSEVNDDTGAALMQKLNVALVNDAKPQYREFMSLFADPDNIAMLCHCSAGKDRTGFGVALFLAALGVDNETIYEDYLISGPYAEAKYRWLLDRYPGLLPVMTVKRDYLKAAFDEIDRVYGGMESYLINVLDVDIERLRALYTE